jgi:broad specificity phosphatase PhoE
MELLLLRHGRSLADDEGKIEGGGYDAPLTETGWRQAELLSARLLAEGYLCDRLLVSPLQRARQTAEVVAKALQVKPVYDKRLAELHLGVMSGRPIDSGVKMEAFHLAHRRFPEGESHLEHIHRVNSFYMELQERHSDQAVCIVAHGGTLGILIKLILGLPMNSPHWQREGYRFRMADTAMSRFTVKGFSNVEIHGINDAAHLQ